MILYHAGCPDGFGAAWSFFQKYGNSATYVPVFHGRKPPVVKGCNVFIVDFCYPLPIMKQIAKDAASIVVLDHHKTAEATCGDLKYCNFDMTQSGAVLSWKYVFPNKPVPTILQYIQDRDLWEWKLPNTEQILSVVDSYDKTFENWNFLDKKIGDFHSDGWNQTVSSGIQILNYKDSIIKTILSTKHKVNILGDEIVAVNSSCFQSELGNILSKNEEYAAVYFYDGQKYRFSLRSNDSGTDVSEVALEFGGGGHRNASGFLVESFEDLRNGVIYEYA